MANKRNKGSVVTGCWDGLHTGHLHLLTEAMQYGPVMVLVMSDDYIRKAKGREPMYNCKHRVAALAAIMPPDSYIQEVPDAKAVQAVCDIINPTHRVVGDDYTPEQVVKNEGAVVVIVPRIPGYSSTALRTEH